MAGTAKVSVRTQTESSAEYVYASGKIAAFTNEMKDGWLIYTTDRFDSIPYWGAIAKAGSAENQSDKPENQSGGRAPSL